MTDADAIVFLLVTTAEPVPPPPAAKLALADDEALINPHFMQQLLRYGLQMGLAGNHMDAEQLATDAQVRVVSARRACQFGTDVASLPRSAW